MTERLRPVALAFACLLVWGSRAAAQTTVPVVVNGDSANRVDVVFLGDGYTADEMAKFSADVNVAAAGLLSQAPFNEYQPYFNVRRIEVASNESGATHDGAKRDTAFGAYYNCSGIERLICVNTSKVLSVVTAALPANQRDLIIVLVNDTEYGGSGGSVTVASLHRSSIELVLHEMAHTFGQLDDEYGGPPPPACVDTHEPSAANVTKETERSRIKWVLWIDPGTPVPTTSTTNGVPGLFQGADYCDTTLYRPTYNSKMRSLGQPFHPINVEQLIRRIYVYVDPIESVSPATSPAITLAAGESRTFSVTTIAPAGNALAIAWWVDGRLQASSAAQYSVSAESLGSGSHTVRVVVTDPTSSVRNDPQGLLTGAATWTVTSQGSVPDFTIVADKTIFTLTRGQSATFGLTLTPLTATFASAVTFSCAGLPDQSQCAFNPATVPAGSATTPVTMTVTTTAPGSVTSARVLAAPEPGPTGPMFVLSFAVPALLLLRGRRTGRRAPLATAALAVAVAVLVSACGGGGSSTPTPKPVANPGTPAGNYAIVVSAASGSVTHTVTVMVTVQ